MRADVQIVAVRRDERFSPNSVERDREIMLSVARRLAAWGQVREVTENDLAADDGADFYVSMARLPETLHRLKAREREGRIVVNTAEGVENCQRSRLERLMRSLDVPMPPSTGTDGWWLKRGDAAAQSKDDVVFCPDSKALETAEASFRNRGITDYVVSAHIVGDLIKFYAVRGGFFRHFYPSDDGITKFGNEAVNGRAHHYPFDTAALAADAARLADAVGVDVYGGDAIIDRNGNYFIIDFNDWPSFSRCREEAAEAIANDIRQYGNF